MRGGVPAAAALLAAALGCAPAPGDGDGPRLLVSIDTLRADRVGAWGDPRARTPAFDRLARRGLQVRDTIAPAPLTLPSHATMLTGLDPPAHGLRDNGLYRLDPATPTIAELLPEGVAAAGFIGGYPLVRTFGLDHGFDVWDDTGLGEVTVRANPQRPAAEVLAGALAWLEHRAGEARPFAFVHLYDPHHPYEAPAPWPAAAAATGGDAYAAEVAGVDRALHRFLARVAETFDAPATVLVTSDHGESLGDHGEPTHANFVYDATQRVPLALAGPGIAPALEPRMRRLADVAATMLDLYGVPAPGGESLRAAPRDAPAYLETMHTKLSKGWSPLFGARTDRWKYVRAPRAELYDLRDDPGETVNLVRERSGIAEALEAFVDSALAGADDAPPPGLSETARRQLAALGYVSAGAAAAEGGAAVDPKDGIAGTAALFRGQEAYLAGDMPAAERALREALAADPALKDAHAYLAGVLLRTGRFAEAAGEATAALALEPHVNEVPLHATRAEALIAQGERDEAIRALEAALREAPGDERLRSLVERARAAPERRVRPRRAAAGSRAARRGTRAPSCRRAAA